MDRKIFDKEILLIKEFSNYTGLSVPTLRNYDRKGILLPTMRGAGVDTKRRHYSPMQITTAKMIRVLAEMRVPLAKIKELTKDRSPDKLLKQLRKSRDAAEDNIRFYQDVHSVIDTYVNLLHEGISATETEIAMTEAPAVPILLGGKNDYTGTTGFMREYTRFCCSIHVPNLNTSFPVGGYWDSMDAYLREPSLPERFFSLDRKGHEQQPAGSYLIGYTRGYYGQVGNLPQKMADYAEKNGLEFSGPVFNLYILDELSICDPNQYLLKASAMVTSTRRETTRCYQRLF